jgi:DNA topoisomerase-2
LLQSIVISIDDSNKGSNYFKPVITFVKNYEKAIKDAGTTIENLFKLESNINTSNMHLFNSDGVIKKYKSAEAILLEYYGLRLNFYADRRKHQLTQINHDFDIASAKLRFVLEVIDDTINIHKKKRQEIIEQLEEGDYPKFSSSKVQKEEDDEKDTEQTTNENSSYNYLLHMRIESFSQETIEKLEKEKEALERRLKWLQDQTPQSLWSLDLDKFETDYKDFEDEWTDLWKDYAYDDSNNSKKGKGKGKAKK